MAKSPLPDIPVATMGWDSSELRLQRRQAAVARGCEISVQRVFYQQYSRHIRGDSGKGEGFRARGSEEARRRSHKRVERVHRGFVPAARHPRRRRLSARRGVRFRQAPAGEYVYFDCATKKQCRVRAADFENISYGPHYKNKLDVWLPKGARGKSPAIIYFHGGGWSAGAITDRLWRRPSTKSCRRASPS